MWFRCAWWRCLLLVSVVLATDDEDSDDDLRRGLLHLLGLNELADADAAATVPDYMRTLYADLQWTTDGQAGGAVNQSIWAVEPYSDIQGTEMRMLHFHPSVDVARGGAGDGAGGGGGAGGGAGNVLMHVELVLRREALTQRHGRLQLSICDAMDACEESHHHPHRTFRSTTGPMDVYDVTAAFVRWAGRPDVLTDTCTMALRGPARLLARWQVPADEHHSALLVLYQNIGAQFHRSWSDRTRRSVRSERPPPVAPETEALRSDDCRLRSWYVPFAPLGWDEWMIEPEGYTANFCSGTCDEPLMNMSVNVSNHAFIKSLYRSRIGSYNVPHIPQSRCVPIRLSGMSLLYRNGDKTVMKLMTEMIATSCGCM